MDHIYATKQARFYVEIVLCRCSPHPMSLSICALNVFEQCVRCLHLLIAITAPFKHPLLLSTDDTAIVRRLTGDSLVLVLPLILPAWL